MHLWTAFLLGLVGSLHCAGMCGPLMLAVSAVNGPRRSVVASTAVYHVGRLTTYLTLGGLFGLLGHGALVAGLQRWVSIGLGLIVLAGLLASRRLALSAPVVQLVGRLKSAMSGLLRRRTYFTLGILGALNGLLPCGLVYVAAAAAVATADVLRGAAYLALFGLGTLPALLAVRLGGHLLGPGLRLRLQRLAPVSVFVLGLLLVVRGLGLGVPFLSPRLADSGAPDRCCPLPRAGAVEHSAAPR